MCPTACRSLGTGYSCECGFSMPLNGKEFKEPLMKPTVAPFPSARLRRTRSSAAIRSLVRETSLGVDDLIWPVFVRAGDGIEEPVPSMPGVVRRSIDKVALAAREAVSLGIPAICLFPYTEASNRSADCAEAWNPDNLSNR